MIFQPPSHRPHVSRKAGVEYRLYLMDGAGHIQKAHEFEAESDADAIRIASAWREGRTMELWQRSRMVKRWD